MSSSQNNWTQNYYSSLKKKNENCKNVAYMMFHMNIYCLQLVGKMSVSELNLKCGRQKYALKLLWPVATKKRQKTVVMIAAGSEIPCSNSFLSL